LYVHCINKLLGLFLLLFPLVIFGVKNVGRRHRGTPTTVRRNRRGRDARRRKDRRNRLVIRLFGLDRSNGDVELTTTRTLDTLILAHVNVRPLAVGALDDLVANLINLINLFNLLDLLDLASVVAGNNVRRRLVKTVEILDNRDEPLIEHKRILGGQLNWMHRTDLRDVVLVGFIVLLPDGLLLTLPEEEGGAATNNKEKGEEGKETKEAEGNKGHNGVRHGKNQTSFEQKKLIKRKIMELLRTSNFNFFWFLSKIVIFYISI